jgi:transposase
MDKLIMSRKEREQLKVFEKLEAREITQLVAGQMLNMSDRNVRKKFKRYREKGDAGLIHQSRGRPSCKRWAESERAIAMDLLRTKWIGFGPTFAAEKLEEYDGIKVSSETLRKAMIAEGLWSVGKRKQQYRQRRDRKLMVGVLVQLDGSPHDWFEGRGPRCTLLVFIDDATSKILWLEFVESESFEGVAKATKKYIERWGRPVSFYVDFGSVFKVNLNNPDGEKKTQYERILSELDIDLSHATSPQAKGRVERCNQTMQDRLIKEMRLAGISSMDEANRFVQQGDFIEKHNARFAVPPAKEGDAHRATPGYDLYKIFCSKEERIVTNDFTVSYKGRILQLTKEQPATIRPKDHVTICQHLDGKITVRIRNVQLNFKEIGMRKQKNLSPVEYVLQENTLGTGEVVASLPLEELLDDLYNQKYHQENRNFSCC